MSFHMRPGSLDKAHNTKQALSQLISTLGKRRWAGLTAIALAVLSTGLSLLGPKLLGDATNVVFSGVISKHLPAGLTPTQVVEQTRASGHDEIANMLTTVPITPGQGIDFSRLLSALGLVLGLYAAAAFLSWVSQFILASVVQDTGFDLRKRVQEKVDVLPLSYLDKQSRGDLLSRITNDVDNVTQTLQQALSQIITSVIMLVGTVGMMVWISWRLAVIALVVVPISGVVVRWIVKRSNPQFRALWKSTGNLGAVVEDAFSGHETALLYGMDKQFAEDFAQNNEQLRVAYTRSQSLSSLTMPIMRLISNIGYALIAVAGGIMITQGSIGLGQIQAFIQYSNQFSQPLGQLAQLLNLMQSGLASTERVFEFLEAPPMLTDEQVEARLTAASPHEASPHEVWADKAPTGARPSRTTATSQDAAVPVAGKDISFRNVTFSYEEGKPVINNLNLEVKAGQMVAIVGPTGAGKTTLVNLLMRFYEVDSGEILLGGTDIRRLDRDELRAQIGMVLQDTWLFSDTITENIRFGKDAQDAEVKAAAQTASVAEHIETMPAGWDTTVTDDGGNISVGERQLLTIARAFLTDAPILILDEATSSVDTRTEMDVQAAMERLAAGRTAFIIAHRLSTIRDANLIVVMEDGDVVEQGTHDQLLAAGGAYTRLYQAQFSAPLA